MSHLTAQTLVAAPAIFHSDPNHVWNRIYSCLLVRQSAAGMDYGIDALDPLLWPETRHLLIGDSHRKALSCLDEFLRSHSERTVHNPLKRAVLQRDLWAVFDWALGDELSRERHALEHRLAEAIGNLALTEQEIRALPDTYAAAVDEGRFAAEYDPVHPAQPFLPRDLFRPLGPWVCISAFSEQPTAVMHFSGRSRFLVFIRLPGGRDTTLGYLQKLRSWPEPPLVTDRSGLSLLNLSIPQFPAGTTVALVRQAILIDTERRLIPTALTESVQLRVYRKITPGTPFMNYINGPSSHDQDFFEFRMSRRKLFAHDNGGLAAVNPGDEEYATFSTHGMDPFESRYNGPQGIILERCRACHSDSGIQSVQSRTQWVGRPNRTSEYVNSQEQPDPITWETNATIARKQQSADFRLLQTLWETPGR